MKGVLLDLITSKKFLAAVTAIAVYIAGRFGFKLDTDTLDRIYAALLVYVGAQGIADNGKAAAEITRGSTATPAAATTAPTSTMPPPTPPRPAVAGMTGAATLLIVTIGLAGLVGCGSKTTTLETALWDCTAPERAQAVSVVVPVLESVIAAAASSDRSKIDLSPVEAAITKANLLSDAGVMLSCAVASAFTALEQPAQAPTPAPAPAPPDAGVETPAVRALEAAQPGFDPQVLRDAFNQLRVRHFPKATFKTVNGTI